MLLLVILNINKFPIGDLDGDLEKVPKIPKPCGSTALPCAMFDNKESNRFIGAFGGLMNRPKKEPLLVFLPFQKLLQFYVMSYFKFLALSTKKAAN